MKVLAAALLSLVLLGSPAAIPAAAQDTAVVAVNTHDGLDVFRLAFQIRRAAGDVVDATNGAVAFSSCSECETIAIAIQTVLIMSDPSVIEATNLAFAINYECSLCETMASAYQFVLTTGGPVRFTDDGNRRLAELRLRLQQLRTADLTLAELQTQLTQITDELRQVLQTQLVPASAPASPSPSPSPSASASPVTSPSPSASPSQLPSPVTSTSPSASSSPVSSSPSPSASP